MITPGQIRAGRALIGWSARELAEQAEVSLNTVQRLELGRVPVKAASVETIEKIIGALRRAGVVLLDDGRGVTIREGHSDEIAMG